MYAIIITEWRQILGKNKLFAQSGKFWTQHTQVSAFWKRFALTGGAQPKTTVVKKSWRCHLNIELTTKMTLRPSRKRKNCENSGQIQAEFQTLQSLIPGIADRVEITEVSFAKNQ